MSEVKNAAHKWLDSEISIGKLLEITGVPRPCGDDLAGAFWQAIYAKATAVQLDLEKKLAFAEKNLRDAKNQEELTAESASRLAYVTALATLRFHFGVWVMNNSSSGEETTTPARSGER